MFERILVPLDGSSRAEVILTQVARLLRLKDSEIILCQSSHVPLEFHTTRTAAIDERMRADARSYLDGVARRLSDQGARVRVIVGNGSPAEMILEIAANEGATMIAMSTHGRSGIARWIMGSVAEKVVRASTVPVLLVRSFSRSPQGDLHPAVAQELAFQRILVPVDGSPASTAVVEPALKFGKLAGAEMRVLHVRPMLITPSPILPGMEAGTSIVPLPTIPPDEDPVVTAVADRFRASGLKVLHVSVEGDPAAEILDRSATQGVDLIVMGTHGRSGVSRWLTGSVAERVLRESIVPLLLVRSLTP